MAAALISFVKIIFLCTVARSVPTAEVIDLGYGLDEKTQFWPGSQSFNFTQETKLKNQYGIPW
jgi:hypothetical protein